jgi:hypothetical protein
MSAPARAATGRAPPRAEEEGAGNFYVRVESVAIAFGIATMILNTFAASRLRRAPEKYFADNTTMM